MKPSIPSVLPPNGILAEHKGITRRFFLSLAGGTLAFPAPLRLMAASLPIPGQSFQAGASPHYNVALDDDVANFYKVQTKLAGIPLK